LLLANDLLRVPASAASNSDVVAIRGVVLLVQALQVVTGKGINLLLRTPPTAVDVHGVVVVTAVVLVLVLVGTTYAHDPYHGVIAVVNGIHTTTTVILHPKHLLDVLRLVWLQPHHGVVRIHVVRLVGFEVLCNVLQSIPEGTWVHVLFLGQSGPVEMLFEALGHVW